MVTLQLEAILIIALFVATSGLAVSRLFARLERPYLFSFSGSHVHLVVMRVAVYVLAAVSSVGVCVTLFLTLPNFAALAIFFAYEAIVLDICSQRVEYVYLPVTAPARSAVRSSGHGTVTRAF